MSFVVFTLHVVPLAQEDDIIILKHTYKALIVFFIFSQAAYISRDRQKYAFMLKMTCTRKHIKDLLL